MTTTEPAHAHVTGDDRDLRDYTAGALGLTAAPTPTRAVWPAAVTDQITTTESRD